MMNSVSTEKNLSRPFAFTLIELLITIAIVGILSLVVAPSFSDFQAKERRVVAINKIIGGIRYTRSLAIRTQRVATMCPSLDSITCDRNWNLPIIIFVDLNNDRKRQNNEPLKKTLEAVNSLDRLKWKAFRNSNSLQFLPSGITNHQNGTFLYCPKISRNDLSKGIIMTKMGRTRLSKDANKDGVQEGAQGRALLCS